MQRPEHETRDFFFRGARQIHRKVLNFWDSRFCWTGKRRQEALAGRPPEMASRLCFMCARPELGLPGPRLNHFFPLHNWHDYLRPYEQTKNPGINGAAVPATRMKRPRLQATGFHLCVLLAAAPASGPNVTNQSDEARRKPD